MLLSRKDRFKGLYPATFTAFDEKGKVVTSGIEAYAKYLIEDGSCDGAFINGTTGESMNLSVPERKAIAEAWVSAFKKFYSIKPMKAIIHIGAAW